jgi:hypothetical protein
VLPTDTAAALTAWVARQRRLAATAATHAEAARTLGVDVRTIAHLVATGDLLAVPDTDGPQRYVTRDSVRAAAERRARRRRRRLAAAS